MPLIKLENPDDPRIDPYRNLKASNETRWKDSFVVEGEKLVRRLLESDFETLHILIGESYVERLREVLPEAIPIYVIPTRWIHELVGFHFHRGVLSCGRRKPFPQLESLPGFSRGRFCCVICPNVTDPENLGSIIRNCAGFGVDLLLLGEQCCDPYMRRVQRVSMGNNFKLPIIQTPDLEQYTAKLSQVGVELLATVLGRDSEELCRQEERDRFALLVGNEGEGLSPKWIELADRRITIPMRNGTDSLNVAVATGIFLHHLTQSGKVQSRKG